MNESKTPSSADIAAEVGHFRSEALRQELETGERMPLVVDAAARRLPVGVQRARPAFSKDEEPS